MGYIGMLWLDLLMIVIGLTLISAHVVLALMLLKSEK